MLLPAPLLYLTVSRYVPGPILVVDLLLMVVFFFFTCVSGNRSGNPGLFLDSPAKGPVTCCPNRTSSVFFSEMSSDAKTLKQTKLNVKARKGHKSVTKGTHTKWSTFIEKVREELGWTLDQTCDLTDMKIGWLKKARRGQDLDGDFREKFEIAINRRWKEKFPKKLPLVWPAWVEDAPWSAPEKVYPPVPHPTINDKLLADPLIGLSLADRRTQSEWDFAFGKAQQRLTENPEDSFLRSMLVWSTLLKGDSDQILKVVLDTATWLQSEETNNSTRNNELWLKRKDLWLDKFNGIRAQSIEDPECVQVVLEDTLMREALLRWLKTDGKFSPLAKRIRSIKTRGLSNDVKTIFSNARHRSVENWVTGAIEDTHNWISAVHGLGLPHLYLIWLTGRDLKRHHQIPSVIQIALNWLDNHKNINDTLVRWGSIWLAGMVESNEYASSLIQQTSKWLKSSAADDDRLVRWAYLWFIGEQGNRNQLNLAIAETTKWLNVSSLRDGTCVRLALLFSVRRAVERGAGVAKQLHEVIDDMRHLVKNNHLIELAVNLAECRLSRPPMLD